MKKTFIKKLSLTTHRIAILGGSDASQVAGALPRPGQSVERLGDSCYENACRLTDAVSLAAPNKTCF